jgi:hypothetical protein
MRTTALKREFLIVAERCSINCWPNRTAAPQNVFGLQELFTVRDQLRFDYLIKGHDFDEGSRKSFSSIATISPRGQDKI